MAKRRKRTSTKKKTSGRRGRRPALQSASVTDLMAELRRRQGAAVRLERKRDTLLRRLHDIDAQLADLGVDGHARRGAGGPGGRGRTSTGRPRNEMTLKEALQKALGGRTLGVSEAAEAVQMAGYRTTSSTFRIQVNSTLLQNPDLFKKVSRGQYTAK